MRFQVRRQRHRQVTLRRSKLGRVFQEYHRKRFTNIHFRKIWVSRVLEPGDGTGEKWVGLDKANTDNLILVESTVDSHRGGR